MQSLRSWLKAYVKRKFAEHGFSLARTRTGGYRSETSKCRGRLATYCTGCGVDLGFGGDPINEAAIRVDLPQPYAHTGSLPVQLPGDASRLPWFRDGVLDYVYSSHLLEDFDDTKAVLSEWLRVLKPGGRLVLFCPDERVFREYCRRTGQPAHGHEPDHGPRHRTHHPRQLPRRLHRGSRPDLRAPPRRAA